MIKTKSPYVRAALVFVLLVMGCLVFNTGRAEAVFEDGSAYVPGPYPTGIVSRLNNFCSFGKNGGPQTSAQTTWLSPAGDVGSTQIDASSSTTIVMMRLNVVTKRCWPGIDSGIFADRFRPKAISYFVPGVGTRTVDISSLSDIIVSPPTPTNPLAYSRESWVFPIDISGMTSSGTVVITATSKQFSWRSDGGGFMCIMGYPQNSFWGTGFPPPGQGNEPAVLAEFERICPNTSPQYPIFVNMVPRGRISGGVDICTTLSGWALDDDSPNTQLDIHVYVDGPAGSGSGLPILTTSGSGHTFQRDISTLTGSGNRTFYVYAIGVNSSGVIDGYNSFLGSVTASNCNKPPTCAITGNAIASPGDPYSVAVQVIDQNTYGSLGAYTVSLNLPAGFTLNPSPSGSNSGTISVTGGTATSNWQGGLAPTVSPGAYTLVATVASSAGPVTCQFDVSVANKPYFQAYGGDVSVGAGFGESCGKVPGATIIGFGRITGSGYAGASSQLAVFALDQITEFASGQDRDVSNPKNLTFANDGSGAPNSTYGGGLDPSNIACIPDYWAGATGILSGNQNITGRTVSLGAKPTIYVDGNARITGSILYAGGTYTDINQIPSFRLIVKGNIYVAPSVTELNGLFVAMPRLDGGGNPIPNTGRFYTCSNSTGTGPPATSGEIDDCATSNLTIYGSVVADTIKLARTYGSLKDATTSDVYNTANPAEKFIYTPEVWLTSDFSQDGGVQAYRNVPPIL